MDKGILLTVLTFFAWRSLSARIQGAEISSLANDLADEEFAVDKLANDTCTCGSTRYKGTLVHTGEKLDFTIGEGVDYKPTLSQCLADCIAPETGSIWTGGLSCDPQTKVSRQESGRKLCCTVQDCTYLPKTKQWVKKEYDQRQLTPLVSLNGVHSVPGNTCLCCTKKTAWGPDVNNHCKYAYGASEDGFTSNDGLAWETLKEALTLGYSQSWWKENCKTYCAEYPEHPVMLKTMSAKSWTEAVHDNLEEMEGKLTQALKEANEIKEDSKLSLVGHVYHLLDETLNEAETDVWSRRIKPKLLADAKAMRDKIEAPYMNKKLKAAFDSASKSESQKIYLQATLMEIDPEVVDQALLVQAQAYLDEVMKGKMK